MVSGTKTQAVEPDLFTSFPVRVRGMHGVAVNAPRTAGDTSDSAG